MITNTVPFGKLFFKTARIKIHERQLACINKLKDAKLKFKHPYTTSILQTAYAPQFSIRGCHARRKERGLIGVESIKSEVPTAPLAQSGSAAKCELIDLNLSKWVWILEAHVDVWSIL